MSVAPYEYCARSWRAIALVCRILSDQMFATIELEVCTDITMNTYVNALTETTTIPCYCVWWKAISKWLYHLTYTLPFGPILHRCAFCHSDSWPLVVYLILTQVQSRRKRARAPSNIQPGLTPRVPALALPWHLCRANWWNGYRYRLINILHRHV